MPQTGWLKQQLFLTGLKAAKSKIKVLQIQGLLRATFWFVDGHPVAVSSYGRERERVSKHVRVSSHVSSYKGINSIMRGLPS